MVIYEIIGGVMKGCMDHEIRYYAQYFTGEG